ncbi:MAG: hypothetical protein WC565_10325, partial [Parcubacteria group bacterium]
MSRGIPSIHLKPPERRLLEAYAKQEGLTITDLVRRSVLGEASGNIKRSNEIDALEKEIFALYPDGDVPWLRNPIEDDDHFTLVIIKDKDYPDFVERTRANGLSNPSDYLTLLAKRDIDASKKPDRSHWKDLELHEYVVWSAWEAGEDTVDNIE